MKIQYRSISLNRENKLKLTVINNIVEEYLAQDYILTLRQLYYQLVSRNVIANNQKEYAKLSKLLKEGRMAGVIDWNAIEDRGRKPRLPYFANGISDALTDIKNQYRLPRLNDQKVYIEIWIEKEALSNIFNRVADPYHINLMVNKGYSSCSAMHEAAKRFRNHARKDKYILYFGDHDPSGKDMVRDIRDRMKEFNILLDVISPALTYAQVQQYNLPENPVKLTDSRASDYIAEFGEHCWELDALEPSVLLDITETEVKKLIDIKKYNATLKQEAADKEVFEGWIDEYNN